MRDATIDRLVPLFHALADPTRLRILGAVAAHPRTGRELSHDLDLTPPTISHHVARLTAVGLLRATPDGTRRTYSLDDQSLRALSRDLGQAQREPDAAAGAKDQERAKIRRAFFDGERLTTIPAQRKKRVVVLQILLERFDPERDYPERAVNDLLRAAHPDVAILRRELVVYGFMVRAAGVYRVAAALPPRGPTVRQETTGDEDAWLRDLIAGATARRLTPANPTSSTKPLPHQS